VSEDPEVEQRCVAPLQPALAQQEGRDDGEAGE
jgi:hypothetical protein